MRDDASVGDEVIVEDDVITGDGDVMVADDVIWGGEDASTWWGDGCGSWCCCC